ECRGTHSKFCLAPPVEHAFMAPNNPLLQLMSAIMALILLVLTALAAPPDTPEIDFNKARELLMKEKKGDKRTPEERAYLERTKAAYRARNDDQSEPARGGKDTTGLIPLTDLGDRKYKGETGGLYDNGKNEPPAAHAAAAKRELARIRPLDSTGQAFQGGKIVFLSIGMSNTTQEFSLFKQLAERDPDKSS